MVKDLLIYSIGYHYGHCKVAYVTNYLGELISSYFMNRDIAGDVGVSGGFETMKDGRDVEGWIETVSQIK